MLALALVTGPLGPSEALYLLSKKAVHLLAKLLSLWEEESLGVTILTMIVATAVLVSVAILLGAAGRGREADLGGPARHRGRGGGR